MPSISIRFKSNAGDVSFNDIVVDGIDPYSTTCKDLIKKFCDKSRTPFVTETDQICYMHNGKILNSTAFLDKLLSDKLIRITETGKVINIKDMDHLIGQNN